MRTLVVMRHGHVDGEELTALGKSDTFNLATKLKELVPGLDAVFYSPATRTAKTAEIVKGVYGNIKAFKRADDLIGNAPHFVCSLSREFANVCIVTHEPDISDLMRVEIIEASPLYKGRTHELLIVKYVGNTWHNVHYHTLDSQKVVFV